MTETDDKTHELLSTENDRKRALIDLADQIITTAEAEEEARGTTHAYNDTIWAQRGAFIAAAAQIGITGQAAEDLADSYGLIPRNVTTTVVADTQPARRAVQKLIDDTSGLTVGIRYGGGVGALEARASGGPVAGGRTYLVGEEGPELFTADVAGTIIPAGQTAQIMNSNSGPSAMSVQAGPLDLSHSTLTALANIVLSAAYGVISGTNAAHSADALYWRGN